jgi:hypothetical protein
MSNPILCTVCIPDRLPTACHAPAVAIVRIGFTMLGTMDTCHTEPLHAVPSWAMWTGHAVCADHQYRFRVEERRGTTTLHADDGS